MDTDSFNLYVKTEDVYEDMNDMEIDTSDYPNIEGLENKSNRLKKKLMRLWNC